MKDEEKRVPSSTDVEVLGKLKALLNEVVPHLLAKNGSKHHDFGANIYLMQLDSSLLCLTWKMLRRDQLSHELGWLKTSLIESLGYDVFSKVCYTYQVFTDSSPVETLHR